MKGNLKSVIAPMVYPKTKKRTLVSAERKSDVGNKETQIEHREI